MTINFYILSENRQLTTFVCQLVQTILNKTDEKILILTHSQNLEKLDNVLWSFEPSSFIPHEIINPDNPTNVISPVILTDNPLFLTSYPIVINLTPMFLSSFGGNKLLEIIDNQPQIVQQGREKYRHYQQVFKHIAIKTFKIT